MLALEGIEAGYGETRALFGVSLGVAAGEAVALLGRNGMGKTTTVRVIMGLIRPSAGRLEIDGVSAVGLPPFRIARQGLGLVPEGRQTFPTLSVAENLIATARPGAWNLARVYELFPRLAERQRQLARALSGGEQQMLAIGRALMTNPRLLILDEATEGLAPLIRAEIWGCLARIRAEGMAVLVIDKSIDALMELADRHVIIENGVTVWTGTTADLASAQAVRDRYLHL